MRRGSVFYLATAVLVAALGCKLLVPAPVEAVAREFVELQQSVGQLIQGQKNMQTAIIQDQAVEKTLIELSLDSVNKFGGAVAAMQKSVQDTQAHSGAQLDTMSAQIQGVSENLQEMLARIGKLNQQLADSQNVLQGVDAKLAESMPAPPITTTPKGHPTRSNRIN